MATVPASFPFPTIRPGQAEFLEDARAALARGEHLLAHAPTGLGKTAVALAAAVEAGARDGRLVLFLTAKQSHHRIAVDTLARMRARGVRVSAVDIVGKQSMCLQDVRGLDGRAFHAFCDGKVRSRTCEFFARSADAVAAAVRQRVMHVQDLIATARSCGVCPFKVALESARGADIVVCDYNYIFSDASERILPKIGRDLKDLLLVVDEAHNLPDRVRAHLCGDLAAHDLLRAGLDARGVHPEAAALLTAAGRAVVTHLATIDGERIATRDELVDAVETALPRGLGDDVTFRDLAVVARDAGTLVVARGGSTNLPQVAAFLRRWAEAEDDAILRLVAGGSDGRFAFRLLDPAVLAQPVFDGVAASVLMSGTLHPPEMYADLLGIRDDRRWIRVYGSPFPPENRIVLVHPEVTTRFGSRTEGMYAAIARHIADVVGATAGNVASFFPSYETLGRTLDALRPLPLRKRLLVERSTWDKARRDRAVDELRTAQRRGGTVLLAVQGGSFSEGVDYDGNLLSAVVVVGLPIPPPSVATEALKGYYARKFGERGYEYAVVLPAVSKVLQAAGRPIRSERDRAVIVVLENRLLDDRYGRLFPEEFAWTTTATPATEVRRFFSGRPVGAARAPEARGRGGAPPHAVARPGRGGQGPPPEGVPAPLP